MQLIPVTSSNINAVGYEADSKVLTVQFKNGSRYRYREVPEEVFADFVEANSPGSFFASDVKDQYPYERG